MTFAFRQFDLTDQNRFAELSGDRNAIHLDKVAVRRSELGAPVVHGVHALLWAIDALCREECLSPAAISAQFLAPVFVGNEVAAQVTQRAGSSIRLELCVRGIVAAVITLNFERTPEELLPPRAGQMQIRDWPEHPIALDLEGAQKQSGAFPLGREFDRLEAAFPAACACLTPARVGAILALSRLVGMVCPGANSLLKGFEVGLFAPDANDLFEFRAREINSRFRFVTMEVRAAGLSGAVSAFLRHGPVAQPSIEAVARSVRKDSYAGARVLVLGGSRGLGEVIAKAVAAGGARVVITHNTGRAEAERLAGDISAFGAKCEPMVFDIRGDVAAQLAERPFQPTHLFYCAAPARIWRRGVSFDAGLDAELTRFFVDGFFATCQALAAEGGKESLRVFYPSADIVASPPRGFDEFARAKRAGEALCANMQGQFPNIDIVCRRLPRLATDRNATVIPTPTIPVLEAITPTLRTLAMDCLAPRKSGDFNSLSGP